MAQITWRDVATPDFGSASQSFNNFSKLFGDSIAGLKGAVGGFDQAKSDIVNKQLALWQAQNPDVDAQRAAVAAGQLGGMDITSPDFLRRVSETNLASLGPAAMIKRESDETKLVADKLTLDENSKNFSQRNSRDDQAPQKALLDAAMRSGNIPEAEKIRAGMDFTNFGWGAVADLNTGMQSTDRNQLSNDSSRFELGSAQETKAATEEADRLYSQIMSGAETADDIKAQVYDPNLKVSSRGRTALERRLASENPGMFSASSAIASAAAAAAAGGGGGAATGVGGAFAFEAPQQAVASTLSSGGLPPAVVAGFLGNFHIEGGYGGAKGDGGSASGIAQWRNERRANFKSQFGKDPSGATAEEQAKFVLWEMENPGKAGMTVAQRDAILAAKTPQEAAELIDKHFERSSGEHRGDRVNAAISAAELLGEARQVNVGTAVRRMQDSDGLAEDLAAVVNDRTPVGTIVDRLISPEGHFRGTNRGWMIDKINKVMREANVNAAAAEAILVRSIDGTDENEPINKLIRQASGGTVNLGGKARLNDRLVDQNIARFKSGAIETEINTIASSNDVVVQRTAAQANVSRLQAQLAQTKREAILKPNLALMIPRREAELQAALTQLAQLNQAGRSPSNTPAMTFARPAAQAPRPVAQTSGGRVSQLLAKYTDGRKTD